MQGNSTCLSRKSIAHIVRKLHKIYLLDKVSSSGLAFYIEIGTNWKYNKLLRGMNLLETTPFVLQNTLKLFMAIHSKQKDTAEKNPKPEVQLAWMSGSQHQFFCSANLFEWHHSTCQHRHFFHQYPVKTSAPSKTHRYGTISVSQIFPEAKTQLGRLNWMAAAVTASSCWLFFYPRREDSEFAPHFAAGMLQTIWIFWLLLVYNRWH